MFKHSFNSIRYLRILVGFNNFSFEALHLQIKRTDIRQMYKLGSLSEYFETKVTLTAYEFHDILLLLTLLIIINLTVT